MFHNPTTGRRLSGRVMVLATIAVALPLTATRAIEYVDIDVPTAPAVADVPAAAAAPAALAPVAPVAPIAAVAPVAPLHPARSLRFDDEGTIHMNGKTKHWNELTPEEKAEVRRSIAEAKAELARTRIDREEIQRNIREAMEDAKIDKEELRRDLAEARAEVDQALREVDAHAVEIRRSGQDPETIKAQVRASLKAVEAIDVEAITRKAMASIDHRQIEASIAAAHAGIAKAEAEIERLEQRYKDD